MNHYKKKPITGPDLMNAAKRIMERSISLEDEIDQSGDIDFFPTSPLPIDYALQDLQARTRAPKLIYQPMIKPGGPKQANLHFDVYSHLETAFTKAGLIIGENRAGQKQEIEFLKQKLESVNDAVAVLNHDYFTHKTNFLFKENPLPNRRPQRFAILQNLKESFDETTLILQQVIQFCNEDIKALRSIGKGRPTNLQKEIFARHIGELWLKLTGQPPPRKMTSPFGDFLIAAWKSGFEAENIDDNFERALKHITQKGDETNQT